MVSPRHFRLADLPASPWVNQGGTTREILSLPAASDVDTFAWRVSVAAIIKDGPFSVFPGVERTITLLDGNGVRLSGPHTDLQLDDRGVPVAFDGGDRCDCYLIGQSCQVLNVMARRSTGHARVDICTRGTTVTAEHCMLLSVRGDWRVGSGEISVGSGLWWAGAPQSFRLSPVGPSGQLAIVRWEAL